jgi:hypothetical protein
MPTSTSPGVSGNLPGWAKAMAVLALGIAISGLADFALSQAGYTSLGAYVWAVGYAGTILVLFFVYLRPMELTGPDGEA